MDFHSLSRRELQSLCKKNKIPANMTNLAMVDALAALPEVEGLEEFLNTGESEVQESPKKEETVPSEVPRTALRTSTRRKVIKEDPRSTQPLTRTRRSTAARRAGESDLENKDLNVDSTPALQTGRRRTVASSACKKVDFQMTENEVNKNDLVQEKNEIPETPAVPNSHKRVVASSARRKTETRNDGAGEKSAYSTRRSVRLLEKNMENLSLLEDRKTEPVTVHLSFDEMPNSAGLEKETDMEIGSNKLDASESKSDNEQIKSMEENHMEFEMGDQEKVEMSCTNETSKDKNECETDDEGTEQSSKDNVPEVTAKNIDHDAKLSMPLENMNVTEVDNLSTKEEDEKAEAASFEDNNSVEFSLPPENVEEESEVDDGPEESFMKLEDSDDEYINHSEISTGEDSDDEGEASDIEADMKDLVEVSVEVEDSSNWSLPLENMEADTELQAEDVNGNGNGNLPSADVAEYISEDLVDANVHFEEAPKMAAEIESESLVEISVTPTEEFPISNKISLTPFAADEVAGQFPRPTITKSPAKEEHSTKLQLDLSDKEEDQEEGVEELQIKEQYEMSLRQLKKKFKEQLQLTKKKENSKVGKARTALQPLPENRMESR